MASYWTCCNISPESGISSEKRAAVPLEFPSEGEEGKALCDLYPEQYFFTPFWAALALDSAEWLCGRLAGLAWKLRRDPSQKWPW